MSSRETFKRVLSYARPVGRSVPGYLLLSVFSVVFGVMNYGLLGPLLSVLFEEPAAGATLARPQFAWSLDYVTGLFSWVLSSIIRDRGVIRGLLFVCTALVASSLLANVCRYLSQRILVGMETRLMKNLRSALFDKILSLPVGWFTNQRKGDVLSSISNDVAEVQSGIAGSFHAFFREPLLVVGFLAMLIYMSPQLTLVSLVALPVSAFIVSRITRRLRAGSVETQSLMGRLLSHFDEAISGARIIKAFGARRYVEDRFDRDNQRHRRILRQVRNRQELASPVSEVLGIGIAAAVLFYGGWLNTIAKSYALVQKGLVSADRIFAILDAPTPIRDGESPVTDFREGVTFDHVSFSYGEEPVLRDVCLTIPKGKMVAVVGPSGAGKSTMADLLPRFYDVTEGAIRIDGKDIRTMRLDALTALMGIVTQESILFNDTVFNNIAFAMPGATREAVARAVLKNPPILILDEATSALDTESERLVQDALARLMGGRTSLVIAHRLSTIRNADRIYVIQAGRIVEEGTHEILVANHGLYSHLCKLQDFS